MNDDNKILNKNTFSTNQSNQSQVQVQPVIPTAPVGTPSKETGPINTPISEFMKPSEVEPQISKDLRELGVEAKKDEPNIEAEQRQIIDHAKQFTPVPASSSGKITLPMSEEEIASKLKVGQDDDSDKWLAGLLRKIIAVMGFKTHKR